MSRPVLTSTCWCGESASVDAATVEDIPMAARKLEERGWVWLDDHGLFCSQAHADQWAAAFERTGSFPGAKAACQGRHPSTSVSPPINRPKNGSGQGSIL